MEAELHVARVAPLKLRQHKQAIKGRAGLLGWSSIRWHCQARTPTLV
jgi:hypothetical protein